MSLRGYEPPQLIWRAGRAGTTFGDPAAAAKGDTSEATQFKKSAGDFSNNDSGGAPPDIGSTVRGPPARHAPGRSAALSLTDRVLVPPVTLTSD